MGSCTTLMMKTMKTFKLLFERSQLFKILKLRNLENWQLLSGIPVPDL